MGRQMSQVTGGRVVMLLGRVTDYLFSPYMLLYDTVLPLAKRMNYHCNLKRHPYINILTKYSIRMQGETYFPSIGCFLSVKKGDVSSSLSLPFCSPKTRCKGGLKIFWLVVWGRLILRAQLDLAPLFLGNESPQGACILLCVSQGRTSPCRMTGESSRLPQGWVMNCALSGCKWQNHLI